MVGLLLWGLRAVMIANGIVKRSLFGSESNEKSTSSKYSVW